MATVLRNVGLRVTEHLVQKQKRRAGSRAAFAVLLPGLARGCSNDAYMNTVLRTCSSGAADMTLLLQFGNESKQSASLLLICLREAAVPVVTRHSVVRHETRASGDASALHRSVV